MTETRTITMGSLFDGIGGFPYAASFYSIKTLWASEIIPAAISVTKRHFPDMKHLGDITKLKGSELEPVDIITFGSPCQSWSIAGSRAGFEGKSSLFWEAIRIIREMREATNGQKPRFAVFENVPGVLSSAGGSDYKTVLEAFLETEVPLPPSGRWANAGMVRGGRTDFAWVIKDAQYHGVAQRRRRLFAVCDFKGQRAAEILFKPKSLYGHFAQGGQARKGTASDAQGGAGSAGGTEYLTLWDTQQGRVFTPDGVSPTLAGADGGGGGRNPAGLLFCVNDQGGDSLNVEKTELSPTLRSEAHGNLPVVAMGVHQNQTGSVKTAETAYSLTTASNATARNAPLVCHPDITGTLCASAAGLSRPGGMASETDLYVAYCLQGLCDLSHKP